MVLVDVELRPWRAAMGAGALIALPVAQALGSDCPVDSICADAGRYDSVFGLAARALAASGASSTALGEQREDKRFDGNSHSEDSLARIRAMRRSIVAATAGREVFQGGSSQSEKAKAFGCGPSSGGFGPGQSLFSRLEKGAPLLRAYFGGQGDSGIPSVEQYWLDGGSDTDPSGEAKLGAALRWGSRLTVRADFTVDSDGRLSRVEAARLIARIVF